jgi:hypothetical protein
LTKPPSEMTLSVTKAVQDMLAAPPSVGGLNKAFRYLAKWRTNVMTNTIERREGTTVLSGPFKGMNYSVRAAEGSRSARLLGAYEACLHPVIDQIIARKPKVIIDIGSAEGYYAVGLARRLPKARIHARDASPAAQTLCQALVDANGVADRVKVGGLWGHSDFAICEKHRSVVVCDIEGGEADLLDPIAAPGLCHADILVECHPGAAPGIVETLTTRFQPTHKITRIDRALDDSGFPAWFEELSDLDRLIALWEWRTGPTPWLWMEKL